MGGMVILDITTTAMPRPDIVDRTYKSWTTNLKGVDWSNSTCYINVDPFSEEDQASELRLNVVSVAEKYFGRVVANLPDTPNYSAAYNWVWSSVGNYYVLNLEDDWILKKHVDVNQIKNILDEVETRHEVVFRAYSYKYPCYCTSPALVTRDWCHAFGGKLDITKNPETQIHQRKLGKLKYNFFVPCKEQKYYNKDYNVSDYVVAFPYNGRDCIAIDIGREWAKQNDYDRPQIVSGTKKCFFTSWEKK